MGLGKIYGPYEKQTTPYLYSITGTHAHEVLERIEPYLSEPKLEQAARVRAEIKEWYENK